ncbi:DUF2304 domain-containing protein [Shewanella aestuarii]|uniref:DUF2304 domain-containing protein n=1 Tax=Shewanella aestuarii TaxID=1028752 RepID=A0A6G9QM60_9GAMM|nr:DUF2304 domain-containing protein [Shewanella aestuarii]QIR15137.1 DUF2304 domain-containing protein [Shewanella aestuarii]
MQYYQIFSAFVAIIFFITAFLLVRRDTILPGSAIRWTVLSVLILLLGIFPQLSDYAAKLLGIGYPPILPVLFACMILLMKALLNDIERTKDRVKIDRLIQRVALLEQKIESGTRVISCKDDIRQGSEE